MAVWGGLAPQIIDYDARMPVDLENTTLTISDSSATTRLINDGRQLTVGVNRQFHAELLPPVDDDTVTARVGLTDSRVSNQDDLNRLISASVWSYSFDRTTGEATSQATVNNQLASEDETVDVNGLWVKFPSDAEQTTYQVFDPVLRDSAPAVFQDSSEQDGRTIYRYHQEISPTNVAERYSSVFNTIDVTSSSDGSSDSSDSAAETSTQAYLYHSGTRDYYVDQVTGLIVNVEENIDDYYGDKDGNKLEQALLFDGQGSQEQTDALIAQAATVHDGHVARIVNYVVLAVGILLAILGLAGTFGIFKRKRTS